MEDEGREAEAFLASQGALYGLDAQAAAADPRTWADLCHVMFMVKEFIFIR